MRRLLVLAMVVVPLATGGCGPARSRVSADPLANRSEWDSGDPYAKRASEYLRGFMDGYNSAFPERGYSGDSRANLWQRPCSYGRHRAYRVGWDSGRRTGTNDER